MPNSSSKATPGYLKGIVWLTDGFLNYRRGRDVGWGSWRTEASESVELLGGFNITGAVCGYRSMPGIVTGAEEFMI